MSKPSNTPPNCPRELFGGNGPRTCPLLECRSHNRQPPERGPASGKLVRLRILDDDCARDVGARTRASGRMPTHSEIAARLGVTKQAVNQVEKRAIERIRERFGIRALKRLLSKSR